MNDSNRDYESNPVLKSSKIESCRNDKLPSPKKDVFESKVPLKVGRLEDLTTGILPTLPKFLPLQKTHKMYDAGRLKGVVEGVVGCLGKLSIHATHHVDEATIYAETCEHGKFNVRFYKSIDSNSSFVMEIHRLNSIFGFRALTAAIFDYVENEIPEDKSLPFPIKTLRLPDDAFPEFDDEFESKEDADSAVEETCKMLDDLKRCDTIELGVESMVCLTDRVVTVQNVAKAASNAVVFGEGSSNVQIKIYNLITKGDLQGDKSSHYAGIFGDHVKVIRRGALKILINSLETLHFFGESDPLSFSDNVWFQEELCVTLLRDLETASTNPHEAFLASKCLNLMMNLSESFSKLMKDLNRDRNIAQYVENTCRNPHHLLARESHKLKESIGI